MNRNLYTLLALLTVASTTFAQRGIGGYSPALGATCKNVEEGTVEIVWNGALNCPTEDVLGIAELGFHSTPDGWTTEVPFDDPGAATLVNDGEDTFRVTIDIEAYYGIEFDLVDVITFVLPNSIDNPGDPWNTGNVGRDTAAGAFGCADLYFTIADIQACAVMDTTGDTTMMGIWAPGAAVAFIDVVPNPATEQFSLLFGNPNAEPLDVVLTDLAGREVRRVEGVRGSRVDFERGSLSAGAYLAVLRDRAGGMRAVRVLLD